MHRKASVIDQAIEAETRLFLRLPSVVQMTGLGRSTIYKLSSQKRFPAPVRLTARAVGWRRVDIERWSEARQSEHHP